MTVQEAREIVCEYGKKLVRSGLVVGTWGNLSVRLDDHTMVITPSGADYEKLGPEDMVVVDFRTDTVIPGALQGAAARGTAPGALQGVSARGTAPGDDSPTGRPAPRPSSEKSLHEAIYLERPDAGAVIHTHPANASVVAAARREIPPILDDLAQIAGPSVRVAKYALPGTKKIVRETMKALKGRNAALMANHGAVCIGRNMAEAFLCCEVLEKGCWAFIAAEFLGGAKGINRFEAALMHRIYLTKYSKLKEEKTVADGPAECGRDGKDGQDGRE